jgi:hypothetical protein
VHSLNVYHESNWAYFALRTVYNAWLLPPHDICATASLVEPNSIANVAFSFLHLRDVV